MTDIPQHFINNEVRDIEIYLAHCYEQQREMNRTIGKLLTHRSVLLDGRPLYPVAQIPLGNIVTLPMGDRDDPLAAPLWQPDNGGLIS